LDTSFLTFLAISAVVIATPGPDTALTIRNALLGGRRAGLCTALGVSAGQLVWAGATSLGLVALLLASEPVFQALKLAGAAYLIYLGVQSLRSALRSPAAGPAAGGGAVPATPPALGGWKAFRQGVINDLANPKMAVFFASVLPQFAPQGQGMLSQLVGLGLVFATLTFAWLALYAAVLAAAGSYMRSGSRLRRAADALAGAALVALGLRVAAAQR
jgi:threonine/homoserine/homoserine lactone efflux protein